MCDCAMLFHMYTYFSILIDDELHPIASSWDIEFIGMISVLHIHII